MRIDYLKYLKCPLSSESLNIEIKQKAENGDIIEGVLFSSKKRYPIIDGIPRFIFENEKESKNTVEAFGYQWKKTKEFSMNYGINEEYFNNYFYPMDLNKLSGKIVLDAGCGNGRLMELVKKYNPKLIIGVDYSDAVELAYERFRNKEGVLIIQADLLNLPLKDDICDVIYSLGVIHHIKYPKKAIKSLIDILKGNGIMHIWVYSREGNEVYLFFYNIFKKIFRRLGQKQKWFISGIFTYLLYPYIIICVVFKKLFKKSFFIMQDYFCFIYKLGFKIIRLIIYDQINPEIAYYPSKNQLIDWFSDNRIKIFHLDMRTNNSWRVGVEKSRN